MELYDIPGMLPFRTEKVNLDEFFQDGKGKKEDDEPVHYVITRPFPPATAAEIETLNTGGITIHSDKTTTVKTDADTKLRIRKLALGAGVENHSLCDASGKKYDWNEKLWKSLDRNPAILRKVLASIWRLNPSGGEENPT